MSESARVMLGPDIQIGIEGFIDQLADGRNVNQLRVEACLKKSPVHQGLDLNEHVRPGRMASSYTARVNSSASG